MIRKAIFTALEFLAWVVIMIVGLAVVCFAMGWIAWQFERLL